MSMNIKVTHPIHGSVNVVQTPTNVTYKIMDSGDKKGTYIEWFNTQGWDADLKADHINHVNRFWDDTCKVDMI